MTSPSHAVGVADATVHLVTTADDRTLRVFDAGVPDGVPVVIHHGTPMSGLVYTLWDADARARGLRLIGYDRPGYGGSTRAPGRSVADAASDTAAIADALGVDDFLTWGISGGGPHVLACAALLGDRVSAAACLSGVAPVDATGLDWMAGMGEDNVEEFGAALQGEDVLRPWLEEAAAVQLGGSAATLHEAMATLLPPADVDLLTDGLADYMHAAMAAGGASGVDGWLDDDLAFVKPWGFSLADIRVPVLIFQGGVDLMVPAPHGDWLASALPHAETRLDSEAGHLATMQDIGAVTSWLLSHAN
ncbi:MAG: alpha/beta fold hydrolase [Actinomycetales bacterium]